MPEIPLYSFKPTIVQFTFRYSQYEAQKLRKSPGIVMDRIISFSHVIYSIMQKHKTNFSGVNLLFF